MGPGMSPLVGAPATDQLVVWVTAGAAAFIVLLGLVPKIGETWTKWLETKRRIAVDRDDADMAELRRQVGNLQDWRQETVARQMKHSAWDRKAYRALVELGQDIGPPPDLF